MQRCPPFAAGFGENQRAGGKVKRREADFARWFGAARLPKQPAGDHQMHDQKQVRVESEDNALAESADANDDSALRVRNRRIECSQQKRVDEANPLQNLAHDPWTEGVEVNLDVRQLGHGQFTDLFGPNLFSSS